MLKLQAFKYELKEKSREHIKVRKFAGCRRFTYNKALAIQIENYATGNKYINYEGMAKMLSSWRNDKDTLWLKEAPYHSLQQGLKDLHKAFVNFFEDRAEFPKFKKKGKADSFRYPDPVQFKIDQEHSRLFLPKLGWISYWNSREIVGEPRNVTISLKCGKVFASIQTQMEVPDAVPDATTATGLDVGVENLITTSQGKRIPPLNALKTCAQKLRKLQRQLSRKTKFSQNWKKIRAKITRLHAHIGNMRKDYLHKLTTTLSKNHALVAVEDLQISNMTASAKGTQEEPGKNVKAKSGLNRSILDQAWGELFRQLDYKTLWNGGYFMKVPPQYSSQTCPCCGHVSKENRKTQAKFLCVECWYENHADAVGAINILDRAFLILSRLEGQDGAKASH